MMVNAILYKVGEEPKMVGINCRGSEINDLIGADGTDSTTIGVEAENKLNSFRVVVDDVGILNKKPRNRGFFGDFVVAKCDEMGFFTNMTVCEIERVKKFFEEADVKHKNPAIEKFLTDLHNEIGDNVKTYDFDDCGWFNMVSVSFAELFDDFRKCQNNIGLNLALLQLAILYNDKAIDLDKVVEIMETYRKQLAEFRHNFMKEQWGM